MWGKSLGQLQTPSINHPACLSTDVGAAVTVKNISAWTSALLTSARRWGTLTFCSSSMQCLVHCHDSKKKCMHCFGFCFTVCLPEQGWSVKLWFSELWRGRGFVGRSWMWIICKQAFFNCPLILGGLTSAGYGFSSCDLNHDAPPPPTTEQVKDLMSSYCATDITLLLWAQSLRKRCNVKILLNILGWFGLWNDML